MAANPYYYTHRHSNQVLAENPNMTRERYMEGFDRANSLVNTMIGVANEVARLAISDGIDAIKHAGLYKQKTKQLCNETFRRQEAYEAIHNSNFGDRLKLWLDYLDGTEDEYRKHIFNIYMAVKMALDKHKQKNTELKAKLECGRICAELAVGQFDALTSRQQQHAVHATNRPKSDFDYCGLVATRHRDIHLAQHIAHVCQLAQLLAVEQHKFLFIRNCFHIA